MSLVEFSDQTILDAVNMLMKQSAQTFSFEPVEALMNETRNTEICFLLGISADLAKRFRAEGLTVDEADKIACRLGEHPSMIWKEWADISPIPESLFDAVEEFMREHKLCGRCEEWVHRSNFHKRSAAKDKIARYCTSCMKVYERERRT